MKKQTVVVSAGECRGVLCAMPKDNLLVLARVNKVSIRGSKSAVIDRIAAKGVRFKVDFQTL